MALSPASKQGLIYVRLLKMPLEDGVSLMEFKNKDRTEVKKSSAGGKKGWLRRFLEKLARANKDMSNSGCKA